MIRRFALLAILGLGAGALYAQDSRTSDGAIAGAGLVLDTLRPAAESKLRIEGETTYTEDELRAVIGEQIREIDADGVSPARADDAAYYIGAHYRKNGFAKVETDYAIEGGKVVVRIKEGPRTLMSGLKFVGNRSYKEEELFQYMIGATPEAFAKTPDIFPYNAGEASSGADRVRGFYVSEGYLDAKVELAEPAFSSDGRGVRLTVTISEGPRYTFGGLRFVGEPIFETPKLIAALREPPDGPFSRTKVVSMQRNLESFYRAKGYFLVKVEVVGDPAQATTVKARGLASHVEVPVTFTITPGHQHRFDGVTVKNNSQPPGRLREDFLPKRFKHLSGQVYDPEKVDETFRELLRSGLFSNLRFTPTALPDDTVRLDFLVEEAKAREVGFTIGFGAYDGFKVGLRLADRNFLNNGRPLTFAADYSQRGLNAEFGYHDQWFLDNPRLDLRAKAFSANREEKGYTKDEIGLRGDLGWKLTKRLEVSAFAQGSTVKITDPTIDPLLLGPTDYTFISAGVAQTLDFRDSPVAPTRGWVLTSAWDLGLVDGEQSFTREVVRFSWYIPIRKCQLALGARVGAIQPIAPSIPIDIRFFNGGATTVRSFSERDLGPKDKSGNPLGGEFFSVFNAEFTFPLGIAGLQGAVFADAGNLTSWDNAGIDDMRYALGVGIRYALPVGPLRLDYGVNPDRRKGEDFGAFHFSFGVAF